MILKNILGCWDLIVISGTQWVGGHLDLFSGLTPKNLFSKFWLIDIFCIPSQGNWPLNYGSCFSSVLTNQWSATRIKIGNLYGKKKSSDAFINLSNYWFDQILIFLILGVYYYCFVFSNRNILPLLWVPYPIICHLWAWIKILHHHMQKWVFLSGWF